MSLRQTSGKASGFILVAWGCSPDGGKCIRGWVYIYAQLETQHLQAILTLPAYSEAVHTKYETQEGLQDNKNQGRLKTAWIFNASYLAYSNHSFT